MRGRNLRKLHPPQSGSQFQFLGNAFALLFVLRPMRPLTVHPAIPNGLAGRACLERSVRLSAGYANVAHGWWWIDFGQNSTLYGYAKKRFTENVPRSTSTVDFHGDTNLSMLIAIPVNWHQFHGGFPRSGLYSKSVDTFSLTAVRIFDRIPLPASNLLQNPITINNYKCFGGAVRLSVCVCPRPKSAGVAHVLFIKGGSHTHLCHVIGENE